METRRLSPAGRRMVAAALPENREERAAEAKHGSRRIPVMSLMGADYVLDTEWSPDNVEGAQVQHNVVARVAWAPSLVRRGERPRVRQHITFHDIDAELAALKASLKGRKGKSRILLKAKIAKMEAARDFGHEWKPETPFVPFSRDPLPFVQRPIPQSAYLGFTGIERSPVPVPKREPQALPFGHPCFWDGVSA